MKLSTLITCLATLGLALARAIESREGMDREETKEDRQLTTLKIFQMNLINHTRIDDTDGSQWRCTNATVEDRDPPLADDCLDVVAQYKALTGDLTMEWTTGCYKITSGTCTGSVCPQQWGPMSAPASLAVEHFQEPIINNCIKNGFRGWWADTAGARIGIYLT